MADLIVKAKNKHGLIEYKELKYLLHMVIETCLTFNRKCQNNNIKKRKQSNKI